MASEEDLSLDTITIPEMTDADIQALYVGILGGKSRNPANDCDKIFRALELRNSTIEDVLKIREAGLRNAAGIFSIGDGLILLGHLGVLKPEFNRSPARLGIVARIIKMILRWWGHVPKPDAELLARFKEHSNGIRFVFSGLHVADAFDAMQFPQDPQDFLPVHAQLNNREVMTTAYVNNAVKQLIDAGIDETIFEMEAFSIFHHLSGVELRLERYKLAQRYLNNPQSLFRELKERCNQGGFFDPVGESSVPVKEIVTQITEAQRDIENQVGEPGFHQLKVEKLRDDLAQMYTPSIGGYAILKKKPEGEQLQNPTKDSSDKNESKP